MEHTLCLPSIAAVPLTGGSVGEERRAKRATMGLFLLSDTQEYTPWLQLADQIYGVE